MEDGEKWMDGEPSLTRLRDATGAVAEALRENEKRSEAGGDRISKGEKGRGKQKKRKPRRERKQGERMQ